MAMPRRAGRSRFPLVVLVLAAITLVTLDARDFGPVESLKDATATVLSPFRSVGDTVFGPVGDAWSSLSNSDELEAENAELRSRIDALQQERIENVGAAAELEQLRAQLDLRGIGGYETVVAEVTAGSVSNFDPYVIEIDKGSSAGIAEGMPVITDGGVIGRVEDVRSNGARVRLITDPELRIGVVVVGSSEIGIVSGTGEGKPLRVTDGIPVSAEVEVGDLLMTSGLDRSPYPEGLAIGTVTAVEVDQLTFEKELVVEPGGQTERLLFVTVVLYDPNATPADAVEDGGS